MVNVPISAVVFPLVERQKSSRVHKGPIPKKRRRSANSEIDQMIDPVDESNFFGHNQYIARKSIAILTDETKGPMRQMEDNSTETDDIFATDKVSKEVQTVEWIAVTLMNKKLKQLREGIVVCEQSRNAAIQQLKELEEMCDKETELKEYRKLFEMKEEEWINKEEELNARISDMNLSITTVREEASNARKELEVMKKEKQTAEKIRKDAEMMAETMKPKAIEQKKPAMVVVQRENKQARMISVNEALNEMEEVRTILDAADSTLKELKINCDSAKNELKTFVEEKNNALNQIVKAVSSITCLAEWQRQKAVCPVCDASLPNEDFQSTDVKMANPRGKNVGKKGERKKISARIFKMNTAKKLAEKANRGAGKKGVNASETSRSNNPIAMVESGFSQKSSAPSIDDEIPKKIDEIIEKVVNDCRMVENLKPTLDVEMADDIALENVESIREDDDIVEVDGSSSSSLSPIADPDYDRKTRAEKWLDILYLCDLLTQKQNDLNELYHEMEKEVHYKSTEEIQRKLEANLDKFFVVWKISLRILTLSEGPYKLYNTTKTICILIDEFIRVTNKLKMSTPGTAEWDEAFEHRGDTWCKIFAETSRASMQNLMYQNALMTGKDVMGIFFNKDEAKK
ncbi:unnamed protein product [Caenorhabditis bovis]|uniref:Uncharacterized protein n=1 Tax=Caenorhabditis bovis TaxID=2654633 RepID=A0A8S1ED55_9PELO|nr:unnamed protein product [Caenorhabditis bovis]